MSESVCGSSALASVLLQRDDSQDAMEVIVLGELKHDIHRLVAATIIDYQNLITSEILLGSVAHVSLGRRADDVCLGIRSTAKVLVKISNGFFEGRGDAGLLIVCRENDTEAHIGGFDTTGVRGWEGLGGLDVLLTSLALSKPAIIPTGER